MNDTNRKVLDGSIIEAVPPFRGVDELIVGERRRQRLRRGVGIIATAAAVAGLVFAIEAGVGSTPASGPSVGPGQSNSGGTGLPTPTPRTVASVAERLSEALQDRLSTQVPDASHTNTTPPVRVDTVDGYTGFATRMSVTRPEGTAAVELLALWPVDVGRAPTGLDRLGACGAFAVNEPSPDTAHWACETRDVDGTFLALGTRREGASLSWVVSAWYSDRTLVRVRADNNPASGMDQPVLSADDIRRILLDGSMRP